jgi:Fe-S oxidoreductase
MSEKSKQIVDACRFCWMCRHICPVGNATGQERNTSRARALALSLVNREGAELTPDIMDNIYECQMCGACTKECVTGWDPTYFTKEVRLQAALEGKTPDYINALVDKVLDNGNIFGATEISADLAKAIDKHTAKEDVILFLGAEARYNVPEAAINAIAVLEKAGVKFTVLADEPASGYALDWLIGAADETKKQMADCAKVLNGYAKVVAFDPADAKVFVREYKEYGIELPAVATFTAFVSGLVKDGSLKVANTGKAVVFQDPYQLARDLEEVDEPRAIVAACAELNEMLLNKKDTMWAGGSFMAIYNPLVSDLVAKERWMNAINVGADTIVTASVSEYAALKKVAPEGKKVVAIEELILSAAK